MSHLKAKMKWRLKKWIQKVKTKWYQMRSNGKWLWNGSYRSMNIWIHGNLNDGNRRLPISHKSINCNNWLIASPNSLVGGRSSLQLAINHLDSIKCSETGILLLTRSRIKLKLSYHMLQKRWSRFQMQTYSTIEFVSQLIYFNCLFFKSKHQYSSLALTQIKAFTHFVSILMCYNCVACEVWDADNFFLCLLCRKFCNINAG